MEKNSDQISKTVVALQDFVNEFGPNDEYTKLIMEVLLEELFTKPHTNYNQPKEN